jgi:hypothetical protein
LAVIRQSHSHHRRHSRRSQAKVKAGDRVVEQHQHAVADEAFKRAFELMNQPAERQHGTRAERPSPLLRGLRKCREATQVAENESDPAPVAFQRRHGRRRQDKIRDLRRKEPFQPTRALDLKRWSATRR